MLFRCFRVFSENNFHLNCIKNQFSPNAPFLFHLKTSAKLTYQKTIGFLMFSGVLEVEHLLKMDQLSFIYIYIYIHYIYIYIYLYIYIYIYIYIIYMYCVDVIV